MKLAVTGTPGTGKTTATDLLEEDRTEEDEIEIIHLNNVIREEGLYTSTDTERDSLITDLDGVADWLDAHDEEITIVESHLAHHFDADRVVVLRCHPETLEGRLRDRGESEVKVSENAEAEALDVILTEAMDRHGEERVYEIDTTEKDTEAVASEIESVIADEREPSAGEVNFVEYL